MGAAGLGLVVDKGQVSWGGAVEGEGSVPAATGEAH